MTKKQRLIQNKSHKKYWGVLAHDVSYKTFRRPNNFLGLIQTQYPKAIATGMDKPNQPLENITI